MKTHCKHGHEFTSANTRWYSDPATGNRKRQCRECANGRRRGNDNYNAKHRAEQRNRYHARTAQRYITAWLEAADSSSAREEKP